MERCTFPATFDAVPALKTARETAYAHRMQDVLCALYVAITRAKKTLTITHARQRMLYGRTNAALPSRFLRELPQEEIVKKGGYAYQQYSPSASQPAQYSSFRTTQDFTAPKRTTISAPTSTATPIPDLKKGDMVSHKAFGKGMVLSVMKMGGDALLEIAFDDIGTKKLMAKTASAHMKKM